MRKAEATINRLHPHVVAGRDICALPHHATSLKEVSESALPIIIHLVTNRFTLQFIPKERLFHFTAFMVQFDTKVQQMSEAPKGHRGGELFKTDLPSGTTKEEKTSPTERGEELKKLVVVLAECVAGSTAALAVQARSSIKLLSALVEAVSRRSLDMRLRYLRKSGIVYENNSIR